VVRTIRNGVNNGPDSVDGDKLMSIQNDTFEDVAGVEVYRTGSLTHEPSERIQISHDVHWVLEYEAGHVGDKKVDQIDVEGSSQSIVFDEKKQ
jgi:hypothetical protein